MIGKFCAKALPVIEVAQHGGGADQRTSLAQEEKFGGLAGLQWHEVAPERRSRLDKSLLILRPSH
ncbi:hypothetical protein ACFJGX_06325 [Hydrogenophaga sp. UC242_50]|uniref:hypothetical protein n=1 Tax=Hydrogenophaga sp. UC242_50 TaxID=3350169 RepID=UPI0036D21013